MVISLCSVPVKKLEGNCSGEDFYFLLVQLRLWLGEEEDALELLNAFHSRKTVTVLENTLEHSLFSSLFLWLEE